MATKQFQNKLSLENFILSKDKSFIHLYLGDLKNQSSGRYVIPYSKQYRLDLISYDIYSTVTLKWIILVINNIYEISELTFGKELIYPTIGQLMNVLNTLNEYK